MGKDREKKSLFPVKFEPIKFGKIGVLVNFFIQKLKSKHLGCLSFLW